jgi:hypothetical protein
MTYIEEAERSYARTRASVTSVSHGVANHCIFCGKHESKVKEETCNYGARHEVKR